MGYCIFNGQALEIKEVNIMAGKTTNYTEAFNIKRSLSKKECIEIMLSEEPRDDIYKRSSYEEIRRFI